MYESDSFITKRACMCCSSSLTIDEERHYSFLCEKCCGKAWEAWEKARSGEVKANTKRKPISTSLKQYILHRDGACLKCGSKSDLTIDHIVSVADGGSNSHDNLQCLCRKCNSIKGDYPEDYREVIEVSQ